MSKYRMKNLILESGERFPLLVNDVGIPVHGPTVYCIAELRNRHRAANTIANAISALSLFQNFLDENAIDLEQRFEEGKLLELGEIEELVRTCRIDRSAQEQDAPPVTSTVCATRIRTIRNYLEWLVKGRLLGRDYPHVKLLQRISDLTRDTINARIPPASSPFNPPEGLEPKSIQHAANAFEPTSSLNPWVDAHTRARNHLIWLILHHLGVRSGELLGIRIRNIAFREGTLSILRQADAPDDPRRRQPNTKTRARVLEISDVLQRTLSDYIHNHRSKVRKAKSHDFLFVSRSGAPLSRAGLDKAFTVLRKKNPELPGNLTPHILRHTWNDAFSEEADIRKLDPETEKRVRSYQMGWNPTSRAAEVYTRRSVRKKAQEVSLAFQKRLLERIDS
jgi:integrase